jgi:hypothetical protein
MTSRRLRRASPDPRLGSEIELSSRDTGSLFDLLGIGKTLASERITAEEPPTDSNQPSCRLSQQAKVGNEDVMDARSPPTVRLAPPHALAQEDGADLAAFDPDAGLFGSLCQRGEAPLSRPALITRHHRPIPLRHQTTRRGLAGQGDDDTSLGFCPEPG